MTKRYFIALTKTQYEVVIRRRLIMKNKLAILQAVIGLAMGTLVTFEALRVLIPEGYWLYLAGLLVGPALVYISIGMLWRLDVSIEE
jgi:hypothetical protein